MARQVANFNYAMVMLIEKRESGFTLIELITVIVIIGVLAVVVGPRFASKDVFEERGFYDDVAQAIRYAQAKANGSGCWTQVDFVSSGFTVSVDNNCNSGDGISATDIINPDGFGSGYSQRQAPPSGMTYSYSVNPLVFDSQGRARNNVLNILTSPASIVVGANTIQIEGATGYVR